jgi:hypothetical protein
MTTVNSSSQEVDLFHRGTTAAAVCVAALAGIGGGLLASDTGTRVVQRADLRSFASGTRLVSYETNSPVQPFVQPTRVERILSLTGLSQRQLADVLNVSHTMVSNWTRLEPDREQLTQILGVVEDARRYHPDLKQWLTAPVSGTDVTPLALLKAQNWRALHGAVRAKPAPRPRLNPEELLARRKSEVSWAIAEPAMPSADD